MATQQPTHSDTSWLGYLQGAALLAGLFMIVFFVFPEIVTFSLKQQQAAPIAVTTVSFPVSVDPANKSIIDNPQADAFFTAHTSSLPASVGAVTDILDWVASLINGTSLYQSLAAANEHLITIQPGYRKEQVAASLAYALNWNSTKQKEFLTAVANNNPGIPEGTITPGTYVLDTNMTPANVAALMNVAFDKNILSHYSTTTQQQVPLNQALTVASLLEREASGPSDMRIISGIIWNRLFKNMNLQIDATLQYAKGQNTSGNWWQRVVPKDKYITSDYNTYAHPGLPPGAISNSSVASVLAALNPVQTSCLYYFHDSHGVFHCSDTYEEHVALLKKYYGQGK